MGTDDLVTVDGFKGPFMIPEKAICADPQGPSLYPRPGFKGFQPRQIFDVLEARYDVEEAEKVKVHEALREVRGVIDRVVIRMRKVEFVALLFDNAGISPSVIDCANDVISEPKSKNILVLVVLA